MSSREPCKHAAAWAGVRYMVFDAPGVGGGFSDRLEVARARLHPVATTAPAGVAVSAQQSEQPQPEGSPFGEPSAACVHVVATVPCEDGPTKEALLAAVVSGGGEGLILRRAASRFVAGRSRDLLKVKLWYDAEAEVVSYRNGGKDSLRCIDLKTRVPFQVTWNRNRPPPPKGSIITYRYQLGLAGGQPRFPGFMRVRDDMQ